MARSDYIGCEVCDGKGLYDGYWDIRDREEISVAALCPRCKLTHDLKAVAKTSEPGSYSESSPGVSAIAAERRRQIEEEGWTPQHDDAHSDGDMAWAAAAYSIGLHDLSGRVQFGKQFKPWTKRLWPWELKWWKPASRERNLIRAGALIAAELDRVIRASSLAPKHGDARNDAEGRS